MKQTSFTASLSLKRLSSIRCFYEDWWIIIDIRKANC